MKSFIKVLLAGVAVAGIAACSQTNAAIPNQVAALPTHVAAAPVAAGPDGSALHPFSFGHKASGGVDITLSRPTAYKPSQSAAGATAGDSAVKLTVTLVNHTSEALDNSSGVWLQATADETGADEIFDTGVGDTAKVLPGRTLKYAVAFDVPKGADVLSVDVSVSAAPPVLTDTYFSGSIK